MELYGFMEREKKIPSYFFIITKLFFPKRKYRLFFFNLQGIAWIFFVFDIQKGDKNNKKEVFNSKFTMRWALGIKRQFKCGK